ncbi:hypothetical protein LIER_02628 [Lithospermum erythrorhizon]|uniref:Reverse transcriptase n=1 Tax=Lithospermum erythrorhizon TaxID=34254 RepID=A0AAV3NQV0_LITER
MIREAELRKSLSGIKITRKSPSISHILFADDTIIFGKALRNEGAEIMRILKDYEEASGPKVNMGKYSLSFSPLTGQDTRHEILDIMGMREVKDQGKYLGLLSQVGRTKKEVFHFIQAKVEKRISGWKGKLLSQAGKEVMVKSEKSTIPNFVMNCFQLPMGIIDELNRTMANFFWANGDGDKGVHWKAWDKMCDEKLNRGLEFKDLECMNLALLAKHGWRIATQEASLLFKLLKGKYFRRTSPHMGGEACLKVQRFLIAVSGGELVMVVA